MLETPGRFRPTIAVCLEPTPVRSVALHTVERAGFHWSPVSAERPIRWLHHAAGPDALLYDLAPFTPEAHAFIQDVRRASPHLPLLLFPPPRRGVGDLVRRCGRLPFVDVELQDPSVPVDAVLRPALERLMRDAPASKALAMIVAALPGRPTIVRQFLSSVLYGLQAGRFTGRVHLDRVARALGTTRRSIERAWKANALIPPRELLAWAVLMLVSCSADALETTARVAGAKLGLGAQQLYRLRRTLLPPQDGATKTLTLSGVWFAFAKRCRDVAYLARQARKEDSERRRR